VIAGVAASRIACIGHELRTAQRWLLLPRRVGQPVGAGTSRRTH
jgi:hypothetical protein